MRNIIFPWSAVFIHSFKYFKWNWELVKNIVAKAIINLFLTNYNLDKLAQATVPRTIQNSQTEDKIVLWIYNKSNLVHSNE